MTIKKVFLGLLLLSLAPQSFAPSLFCCLKGLRRGVRRAELRLLNYETCTPEELFADFLQGFTDAMFEEGLSMAMRGTDSLDEAEAKSQDSGTSIAPLNQQLYEKIMSDIFCILKRHKITSAAIQEHLKNSGHPTEGSSAHTQVLGEHQAAVVPELRKTLMGYAAQIRMNKEEAQITAIISTLNCSKSTLTPDDRNPLTPYNIAAFQRAAQAVRERLDTAQDQLRQAQAQRPANTVDLEKTIHRLENALQAAEEPWTPVIAAQIVAYFTQAPAEADAFFNTSQRSLISRTGSLTGSVVHHGDVLVSAV